MAERAVVVAPRRIAGARQDIRGAAAHHWHVRDRVAVHLRGVEAEEAVLGHDRAAVVETLHRDDIERHGAMHRGSLERLRDRQRVR